MNPANLPGIELYTYCILWVVAIIHALYRLYEACQQYYKLYNCDDIFEDGWYILNRKVDHTDFEWSLWTHLIFRLIPWFCLHLTGAEIFRRCSVHIVLAWYTFISVLCISFFLNFYTVILICVQIFLYVLLRQLNSLRIIWGFFFISTVYQSSILNLVFPNLDEDQFYLIFVILSWLHLRCISFTSFQIMSKCSYKIIFILGYCLYLPCFPLGPVILFEDFISNIQITQTKTWERFLKGSFNFFRYSFWYYFTELFLHFIYIGVLPHQFEMFDLNPWAMCGFGFAMGIFFYLKYLVVYGISGSIVQLEGHNAPQPPRCIACIHLYSHMWRYFDCGLHKFIKNCIYKPLFNSLKAHVPDFYLTLIVSFICFSFIFLWHGLHYYVFIWSFLNFFGLVLELVCKKISSHRSYHYFQCKILSPINRRRLHALLAAPLTIMSAISNFYFFGEGVEVGSAFILFLLRSSASVKFILLFFMYTLSQVSIEYTARHKQVKVS